MSGPDGIDERFSTLVGELRSGEATASPELRDRVRAIATREPEPPAARLRARLPRRVTFALVPICALIAAAVGVGIFGPGGNDRHLSVQGSRLTPAGPQAGRAFIHHPHSLPIAPTPKAPGYDANTTTTGGGAVFGLQSLSPYVPPSGSRAQDYAVDLTLRVSSLSNTTKQAINMTRSWGGYVVSVDSGSDRKAGTAYIVVRIPIVKIQAALAKLTALGTILANHTAIQDVQVQLNQRYSRMQALRVQITNLRKKLTDPSLTQSQHDFFDAAVAQRQGALANLQQLQTAQQTRASFATVSLDLETPKAAAAAPPGKPSQIGRALHNIGHVLVVEAEVLLYVLLIGAPFAVVAALLWWSRRGMRRRSEEQLLAR